jgi:SAM-dependent methyltransferase
MLEKEKSSAITTREFWKDYWQNRPDLLQVIVPRDLTFSDILEKYLPKGEQFSFLEIGGFPGKYSVFFAKYFGYQVSLIDYYLDADVVDTLSRHNQLDRDIQKIEADLFLYNGAARYDIVFSAGFIEHFIDTRSVIDKHWHLLKDDGYLAIALPNFRGLNGLIQLLFDRENLRAHNLSSMSPRYLRSIVVELGMEIIYCDYYGNTCVWLEKASERPHVLRSGLKAVNALGRRIRLKSHFTSPFILLIARKRQSRNTSKK